MDFKRKSRSSCVAENGAVMPTDLPRNHGPRPPLSKLILALVRLEVARVGFGVGQEAEALTVRKPK
jgi:hypothetical protein